MLLRRRPSTSIGRGPLLRKRCAYNPIPEPKVKTRVMTTTEMAITRLAATAVSERSRFSGSIRSSKLHHCLQLTQRRNNPRTLHRLRSSFQHYTSRLTWPAEPRWCEGCEKTAASAPSYSPRFPPGQLTQRYAACAAPAEHDVEVALRAALSGSGRVWCVKKRPSPIFGLSLVVAAAPNVYLS